MQLNPIPKINLHALSFTTCFCIMHKAKVSDQDGDVQDRVLLLHRKKEPNKNKWNGLGGKIHTKETPYACIVREVMEEASIDLTGAETHFGGIVTWSNIGDPTYSTRTDGMYVFIAHFEENEALQKIHNKDTREGLLAWVPLDEVYIPDQSKRFIVTSIYCYLPLMQDAPTDTQFHFQYKQDTIYSHETYNIADIPLKIY